VRGFNHSILTDPARASKASVRLIAAVLCALLLALALLVPWAPTALARHAGEGPAPTAEEAPEAPGPSWDYRADIVGVEDKALLGLLEAASQLKASETRPPDTLAGLRRRAKGDLERLRKALRSEGYYGVEVSYEINEAVSPLLVQVRVELGARYHLADFEIIYEGAPPPSQNLRPSRSDLGIEIGMPARAPDVLEVERRLLGLLGERGHPLAGVVERKTIIQHGARTMTVRLVVDAGPLARFGPLGLRGLERVDEEYLRALVTWRRGESFDRRKIDATREVIVATGLFSSTRIDLAQQPDAQGELPVTISLEEGAQRSIGAGLNYSSDVGFGGDVFWEHRNFFGSDEDLKLSLTAAEIEQGIEAAFRKPLFLRPDQALLTNLSLINQDTDAFEGQSASAYLGVERTWREVWRLGAGLSPGYDSFDDGGDTVDSYLLGLPLSAIRDTRDDPLDPREGHRFDLAFTPYGGGGGEGGVFFLASQGAGTGYLPLDSEGRVILAGRAKVGSLLGADKEEIPANKRLYAGGGGSIRGYEFQKVGPLDSNNDPLGGRSLLELGGEVRIRLTEQIGLVPFIDGGNVFDSSFPDFEEQLRWGAGIGLRYFTGVGPLRVDIAVPLNPRGDVDEAFQFYISFGQAF
jgi:translocation and assembly module TamA